MTLLEKSFPQIREVLLATFKLLGVSCTLPEQYPSEWDAEFADSKVTFQIGNSDFLRFSKYFIGEKLQVEIVTDQWQVKSEWNKRMSPFKGIFQVSTIGFVASDDHIVDLRTPGVFQAAEPAFSQATIFAPAFAESLQKSTAEVVAAKKCPHCDEALSAEALEDMECPECSESFWKCDRCGELINEDPDEATECPKCKKTFATMDCPKCSETIFADLTTCNHCQEPLKQSQCPQCNRMIVFSEGLDTCPHSDCQESLYVCPRCNEYIADDPEDTDTTECPKCHGTLVFVDCPECGEDVLADAESCSRCSTKLEVGKCPSGECGKPIIMNAEIRECPHCNDDIMLITCPHCDKMAYILDIYC